MRGGLRARWEGLCRRCGVCCYEKRYRLGRPVIDWNAPCGWLDRGTRRCTVYAERFSRCRECRSMTIFHALFASYLPDDCGYVRAFRFWRRRRVPEARKRAGEPRRR
jgi:uncharacterized protein